MGLSNVYEFALVTATVVWPWHSEGCLGLVKHTVMIYDDAL